MPYFMLKKRFKKSLIEALIAGGIALGLFSLIVGFRLELGPDNHMIIMSQWGYVLNYALIAMTGRFVYCYYGGGALASLLAFLPASVLFIGYRAWLYYLTVEPTHYSFFWQCLEIIVVLAIIAAFWACFYYFLFQYKKTQKSFLSKIKKEKIKDLMPIIVMIFLIVYPLLILLMTNLTASQKWIDSYAIQVLIYVLLAWGLNIVVGFAGLLDLGYVGFYAIGAYTVALLSQFYHLSFWVCLPLAGIFAAFFGILLGFPVLRLRGDYLAIVTLAFGEIIRVVLINWTDVTGGTIGLFVPKATFFGHPFTFAANGFAKTFGLSFSPAHYKIFLYYILVALLMMAYIVITRLRRSPIGRAWEALREDEIACRALGMNSVTIKLSAFAIGAAFAGLAGAYFAVRQTHIDPTSFVFMESAMILAIVILGGMGSLFGIAVAALAMIGGMEFLREIPNLQMVFGPDFQPEQYRMFWFGLSMIFVMILRPRGLVSARIPTAFLKKKKVISGDFVNEGHG